jgi:hypothetical protein
MTFFGCKTLTTFTTFTTDQRVSAVKQRKKIDKNTEVIYNCFLLEVFFCLMLLWLDFISKELLEECDGLEKKYSCCC